MPAVMIRGIRLGTSEITIILADVNNSAIRMDITAMAMARLMKRLFIRYFEPSRNTIEVPVMITSYSSAGNMESMTGVRLSLISCIS